MNPVHSRLLALASIMFSMTFLVAYQRSVCAEPPTSDAVSIQMSLLNGNHLSLGEPVVLQYKITNVSDQELIAYVGPDALGPASTSGEMEWLRITLTDSNNNTVAAMPNPNAVHPNGLQFTGCRVQVGQFQQGYVVLGKSYLIRHPGDYSLVVSARLPYDVEEPPAKYSPGQDAPLEVPPVYLATKQFTFSLHVTPEDPQKLRDLAGTLRREATTGTDVGKTTMLIESLFSLPEDRAWPEWQTIATDPDLFQSKQYVVIKQLRRIDSLKAADILAKALWTSPTGADAVMKATRNEALHRMYVTGNTKIKRHIRSLYAAHGVSEARL